MEAPAIWTIYPQADRTQVEVLIELLAAELRIPVPRLGDDTVALPPNTDGRVVMALDKVQPDWRERALISPP